MTVYLGDHGFVELKRDSGEPIRVTIGVGDVNVEKRRFSFPDDVRGQLISGDQIDLLRVGGGNLELIAGHNERDWRGFVFIDIMGGIRLYDSFEASIRGERSEAVELQAISSPHEILIQTRNTQYKFLAQLRQFDFTTERETIDTTILGDQFRKRYEAGLISGQGRLECFWDHKQELCDPSGCAGAELPIYLAQLCIRLTQGADFEGRFFIYSPGTDDDPRANRNSVWYEAKCIVTNASVTVGATEVIESSIDFVTTGEIKLLVGVPPSYLLQEDSDLLLLEDGTRMILAGTD